MDFGEGCAGASRHFGKPRCKLLQARRQSLQRHPQIPCEAFPVRARHAFRLIVPTDGEAHVPEPGPRPNEIQELDGVDRKVPQWKRLQ